MIDLNIEDMFKAKKKTFNCEKHGEVSCQVFVNIGNGEPFCPRCNEEKEALEKVQRKKSEMLTRLMNCGVSERFMNKKYSDFKTNVSKEKTTILQTVKSYADNFQDHKMAGNNLIMVGGIGTGKTHLASCLAKQLTYQGYAVEIVKMKQIIRKVRETWGNPRSNESDVYNHYDGLDLLIIDEVGVGLGTDDERNTAYEVLDRRYSSMLPTVVISNCNIEKMGEYIDERSVDRLLENGKVMALRWNSHRRQP